MEQEKVFVVLGANDYTGDTWTVKVCRSTETAMQVINEEEARPGDGRDYFWYDECEIVA